VRRSYIQSHALKIPRDIKALVQKYYLGHYQVRFDYVNVDQTGPGTNTVFVPHDSLKNALIEVFGVETLQCLQRVEVIQSEYKLECWAPSGNDQKAWNNVPNYFLYVNQRPMHIKSHVALSEFARRIQNHFECKRHPLVVLKLMVPHDECDCN
jgi:DNA mismatch repair ATPase MutL